MYFNHCKTADEAKREYRRLAMEMHPDKGGSKESFQELNKQYTQFLQNLHGRDEGRKEAEYDINDILKNLFINDLQFNEFMKQVLGFDPQMKRDLERMSRFFRKLF